MWQQLTTSGLESEQPPPPPLLIPFKHTLKILTVNGGVVAKEAATEGRIIWSRG